MSKSNKRRIEKLEAQRYQGRKPGLSGILEEARRYEQEMQQRAAAELPSLPLEPDLSTGIGRMLAQALAWEHQRASGSLDVTVDCEAWRQQREAPHEQHWRPH